MTGSPEVEALRMAEDAHARAVADLFAEQPNRPADLMSPDRRRAIREHRCHWVPIGCGLPVRYEMFRDAQARAEYRISALCQRCQDAVFDALADIEAEDGGACCQPEAGESHAHSCVRWGTPG